MPATRRLIIDLVRRTWITYAIAGGFIFLQQLVVAGARADGVVLRNAPDTLRWSLTAFWFLAFFPAMSLDNREITLLPVSRRELWIVRWRLAVVAPVVLMPLVLGAAMLTVGSDLGLERLPAVVLYCALYGGCSMALSAAFPLVPATEPGAITRVLIRFICIPLGGAAAPFYFAKYLPKTLGDLNGPALAFIVAAAGVTVASYFYQPEIIERSSPPRMPSGTERLTKKSRLLDYLPGNLLTGLPRLFWVHAREIAFFAPAGFLMIWFIEATTQGGTSNSARHLFHRLQLLPFDVDYAFDGRRGFNVMIWVFIGMGHKISEIMQRARALRILPMSALTLSLVFSAMSVTTTAVVWLWLIGIHAVVAGGFPQTLRLDIFLIFSGALIITRAIELAIPKFAGQLVGMLIFMPLVFLSTFIFTSPNVAMIVAGLACAVGGTVLQYWLLRRRQKIYQFKPPTFFGRPMPS